MATTIQDATEASQVSSSKNSFDLEPNPFEQSFASKDGSKAPNISSSSPQILTPGGRKLPPLVLSPNAQTTWASGNFARTGLTPNESGLRTGLTPGVGFQMNGLGMPGINTPGSLNFTGFTPGLSSLLGTATNKDFEHQQQQQQQQQQQLQLQLQQQPQPQPQPQPQQHYSGNKSTSQSSSAVTPIHDPPATNLSLVSDISNAHAHSNDINSGERNGIITAADAGIPLPTAQKETGNPELIQKNKVQQQQQPFEPIVVSTEISRKPEPVKRGRRKGSTNKKLRVKDEPERKKPKIPQTAKTKIKEDDTESSEDGDESEEAKRKHFLERNRVAASKCRQRKKQLIVKMENDLNFYLNEYNNLTSSIDQLKNQSLIIRQYLLSNNKISNSEVLNSVDSLLNIIERTNYRARLRGNAPSAMVPTVQPINPSLVHANQPPGAVPIAATMPVGPSTIQVAIPANAKPISNQIQSQQASNTAPPNW